jgi:PhnB protein
VPKKSKAKAKKSKSKKAKKLDPIPPGFRTVTPYLALDRAAEAIEWYKKAFGAKELDREEVPGGKIMHARIRIGDSIIMMSDVFPGAPIESPSAVGKTTVTLHVYSKNVDKLWQQALDAGAKASMPLGDQFWGERYGQLKDPFGHNWSLSQRIPMTKAEMKEKQEQAMAMMTGGQMQQAPQDQSSMSKE